MHYNNLAETMTAPLHPDTALMRSEVALIRSVQASRGLDACFRSEQRLACRKLDCEWRDQCCKLIAFWRR